MAVAFNKPVTAESEIYVVGMGELVVTDSPEVVLSCFGLGSCIAVCAYDNQQRVGGMAHIVLPKYSGLSGSNPAKFADTAVPLLLGEMVKKGGIRSRLIVKVAGGAQMTLAPGLRDTFKTGERNIAQVMLTLQEENITLAAADTGGNVGRTVKLYVGTGHVTIKTANGAAKEL